MKGSARRPANAAEWSDHWRDWFRRFSGLAEGDALPTQEERIVPFLRHLRDRDKPAWQRLQAFRAIADHLVRVQRQEIGHLQLIEEKLSELSAREQAIVTV